jgi:hypothetical protein
LNLPEQKKNVNPYKKQPKSFRKLPSIPENKTKQGNSFRGYPIAFLNSYKHECTQIPHSSFSYKLSSSGVEHLSYEEIQETLRKYTVIAVVGLSNDEDKPSYQVAAYMKVHGYKIVPVNPFVDEVLGEKSYKSLLEIPVEIQRKIEIINIFRRPDDVLPTVEQAVKLKIANGKPYVVWMQLGIINEQAAETARKANFVVIMDRCIKVEHTNMV